MKVAMKAAPPATAPAVPPLNLTPSNKALPFLRTETEQVAAMLRAGRITVADLANVMEQVLRETAERPEVLAQLRDQLAEQDAKRSDA